MRGEYQGKSAVEIAREGSPPHARGILRPYGDHLQVLGITPACAGNTLRLRPVRFQSWDHPRMRGEYQVSNKYLPPFLGSPPHARGILLLIS